MQYFFGFFVAKRSVFLISILILLLYGFPSCCDDDNATSADDTAADCRYEVEEEGILIRNTLMIIIRGFSF
ncbi:MAG: hypothetical protein DWQ05_21850 [Calditrichaeota bacterium]|nr:MAG: hypothetical protein DWQ05_21850 [Calditrichota bacterium]